MLTFQIFRRKRRRGREGTFLCQLFIQTREKLSGVSDRNTQRDKSHQGAAVCVLDLCQCSIMQERGESAQVRQHSHAAPDI